MNIPKQRARDKRMEKRRTDRQIDRQTNRQTITKVRIYASIFTPHRPSPPPPDHARLTNLPYLPLFYTTLFRQYSWKYEPDHRNPSWRFPPLCRFSTRLWNQRHLSLELLRVEKKGRKWILEEHLFFSENILCTEILRTRSLSLMENRTRSICISRVHVTQPVRWSVG